MDAQDYPIRHFQEMDRLATTLKDLPAQVLDHAYFFEAFGSWSMTIRYKGCPLRLTFGGKEGEYRLEKSATARSPYAWSSVWNRTDLSEDEATPSDHRCNSGSWHGWLIPQLPNLIASQDATPTALTFRTLRISDT